MPATERLPGTLGPYRLQDRLGEGGMGVVHLARDPQGSLVAVKVLRPDATESVNARLRLAREVETMRRVRSPFVAEVLDADVTGEFPYIVTRYVSGPTLEAMVRSRGPLSGSGLRLLAYGTAEALTAIHAAGIVHRDLKPGNVMLTDDRPVVIDFGIAQSPDATRLTQAGLVMGTPGYLAPEVIEGRPSSPAADVHSWGATLAYAATGRAPFGGGGDTYQTIFYRIISGRPDLSGVPAPLVPLLTAALDTDPTRRPSATWLSAQATALDLSVAAVAAATASAATASPVPPGAGPRATAVLTGAYPGSPGSGPAAADAAPFGLANPPDAAPPGQNRRARKAAKRAAAAAYPEPKQAARNVADLLPPVSYAPFPPPAAPGFPPAQPPGARKLPGARKPQGAPQPPGAPQPMAAQQPLAAQPPSAHQPRPAQQPRGAQQSQPTAWPPQDPNLWPSQASPRGPSPLPPPAAADRAARTTLAGPAVMIAAVALALILPVFGLIVSLALITLARAGDRASSALAVRRSVRGPRASDPLVALASMPLALARALLTEALMAPLAFAAAAVVYVITLIVGGTGRLPQAGAYAAAAIVAWYGLGPGSGKPRRQVNRLAGAAARTPLAAAVTALALWALAAAVVIFALAQQAPYYWPLTTPHLPALHGWPLIGSYVRLHGVLNSAANPFSSAANWLFRQVHG